MQCPFAFSDLDLNLTLFFNRCRSVYLYQLSLLSFCYFTKLEEESEVESNTITSYASSVSVEGWEFFIVDNKDLSNRQVLEIKHKLSGLEWSLRDPKYTVTIADDIFLASTKHNESPEVQTHLKAAFVKLCSFCHKNNSKARGVHVNEDINVLGELRDEGARGIADSKMRLSRSKAKSDEQTKPEAQVEPNKEASLSSKLEEGPAANSPAAAVKASFVVPCHGERRMQGLRPPSAASERPAM